MAFPYKCLDCSQV